MVRFGAVAAQWTGAIHQQKITSPAARAQVQSLSDEINTRSGERPYRLTNRSCLVTESSGKPQ
jgi:hypothetical protein